jgi:hypothetical protein
VFGLRRHHPVQHDTAAPVSASAAPVRVVEQAVPGPRSGTRDFTFAVPKSVSIMMAILPVDDPRSNALIGCHDAALHEILRWLDEEAAFARSGPAYLDSQGLKTNIMRHFGSASRQPHLHSHVLVEPTVTGLDGHDYPLDWSTLDQVLVLAAVKYLAALRDHLTRRLGVRWTNGHRNDIVGLPAPLLQQWTDTGCALAGIPQTIADPAGR